MKAILTVAVISLIAVAGMRADVLTKGGAAALVPNPAPRSVAAAPAHAGCAMCKSEFITRTSLPPKGSVAVTTTVERHLCPSCVTTIKTVGGGKAKTEAAVHVCGNCKS